MTKAETHILEALYDLVESRKEADPEKSWTARLFHKGTQKIAQKLGEEAIETVIEAVKGDRNALADESADLLFHLLVLWADQGLKPQEVWSKLEARRGASGIAERASRKKG